MCGITGIISSSEGIVPAGALHAMTNAIKHRGPDDYGYYESVGSNGEIIGLGHRRLAIIDVDSGEQPITNEEENIFLVFNGEIYNYQSLREELIDLGHVFSTSSDSEVIVHAYEEYGEECVNYFRGMFSFAIWDCVKNSLYLARDRFGKKPLFYLLKSDVLLFSSEIKSFCALPGFRSPMNLDVINDYMVYRYVPGPATLYKDVVKLEPGSYAIYHNGVFRQTRYYSPKDGVAYVRTERYEDPVKKFLEILRESVSLRMISDVPYGAFLSGGIDSSAIVGLMTEISQVPVKTFSVGFEESGYSELGYAEVIANYFNTEHHELLVSHEEIIRHLPELVSFRDAPISEPSDIPIYLLAKEASKTVKMVLTGEGSDEILAGYSKHVYDRYASYYKLLPKYIREYVVSPLTKALPYSFRSVKTAISTLDISDYYERQPRWFGALSYREASRLLVNNDEPRGKVSPSQVDDRASALRKILYFDQTSWLPDNLLERGDRMTMAASIEARMPFMDHQLAEYMSSLPDRYRIRRRTTKWILRKAMQGMIPRSILNRPKVGFRLPVNEWFRGPMKEYLYDCLMSSESLSNKLYRQGALKRIMKEHMDGRQNHEKLLWTMLNLEIWYRQNQSCFID